MKGRLFILVVCLMLIGIRAYAQEDFYISGENGFNEIVDEIMSGKPLPSVSEIINGVLQSFTKEVRECGKEIAVLVIIALMSGVLNLLSDAKSSAGSEAAVFCCFTVMSVAALNCFNMALQYGKEVISAMADFITKLSPALMLTLIACGKSISASVFRPVLSSAIYLVGILVEKVMIPLCVFGAVLSVSGNIGGENRLSGLCRTVGSVNKWIMAAIVTVFTGISSIYGFTAPSLDVVATKTAKFAAGTLVPVVGGFLSDTLETVISGSKLIKNAVGTAGVITVCTICLIPIIKIGVIHLMLRLASAVAEPVADKRISAMLADMATAIGGIFALTVMTAVLFILNLSIILATTSA